MKERFSKTIYCGNQEREFHFSRANSLDIYFHVSVVDEKGDLHTFRMARDEKGQWKLMPQAVSIPQWALDAEGELGHAIEEKEY